MSAGENKLLLRNIRQHVSWEKAVHMCVMQQHVCRVVGCISNDQAAPGAC